MATTFQAETATAKIWSFPNTTLPPKVIFVNPYSYPIIQRVFTAERYLLPLAVFLGIFGNTMTILLVARMKAKARSAMDHFYLALAVADLVAVLTGPFPDWFRQVTFYDLKLANDPMCAILAYLINVSGYWSTWFLVAMTMQRAASVLWPHRVNSFCTLRRIRMVIVVIALISSLVCVHLLMSFRLVTYPGNFVLCTLISQVYMDLNNILAKIDGFFVCWLPFGLLLVSNSVLVARLRESVTVPGSQSLSNNIASAGDVSEKSRNPRFAAAKDYGGGGGPVSIATLSISQSQQAVRLNRVNTVTLTVFVVSTAYFLLTFPLSVANMVSAFVKPTSQDHVNSILAFQVVAMDILYFSYGINFYLYCLTGEKLRGEFKRLLCPGKRSRPNTQ